MNLAFNEYGQIQLDEDNNLFEAEGWEAELCRLYMFFDTQVGFYPFDRNFGNTAFSILGKIYIEEFDLDIFDTELKNAFQLSGFSNLIEVSTEQIDPRILETTVSFGGEDIRWHFHTSKGRLKRVNKEKPEIQEYSHEITIHYIQGTSRLYYDMTFAFEKCIEENSIAEYEDTTYSHRLFLVNNEGETGGQPVLNYELNDFTRELKLTQATSNKKWLRFEIWPSDRAQLVSEVNPYILRK